MSIQQKLQKLGLDYDGLKSIFLQEAIDNREVIPFNIEAIEKNKTSEEIQRLLALFVDELISEGCRLSDLYEALDAAKAYVASVQAEQIKKWVSNGRTNG